MATAEQVRKYFASDASVGGYPSRRPKEKMAT